MQQQFIERKMKKKNHRSSRSILLILLFFLATESNSLSSEQSKLLVNEHISGRIKAFKENLYINGGNGLNRESVRLTVLRAHDDDVMMIWYPYDDNFKNSSLIVKKLKKTIVEKNGVVTERKFEISFERKIDLKKSQSFNLSTILGECELDTMGITVGKEEELDGSLWVYEFANFKSGIVLKRKSPFILSKEYLEKNSKKQIVDEKFLTLFGISLWMLSANGELELY